MTGMIRLRDYDEALAYLDRLVATPVRVEPGVGLERTRRLLAAVGDPHARFAAVHVTGSSGKGSTATATAAILRASGRRVGLFTSPDLVDKTERIVVDGAPIPRDDWTRLLTILIPHIEAMAAGDAPDADNAGDAPGADNAGDAPGAAGDAPGAAGDTPGAAGDTPGSAGRPAFMEVLWALAALYFAERGVEVAVVEAGMGARYDPTIINDARVGVITNVTLEHTRRLGPTVAAIAAHKAGVAKPGGIVVTASRDPAALDVIAAECARQGATLWRALPWEDASTADPDSGRTVRYKGVRGDGGAATLDVSTPVRSHEALPLALLGRHQYANAACAVAAVDALGVVGVADVDEADVRRALARLSVPGRLEWVASPPGDRRAGRSTPPPPTLLDGAHNPDAARALADALRDLMPRPETVGGAEDQGGRVVYLLGILGDKDAASMVAALAPLAAAVVVTEPPWPGRMGAGPDVVRLARGYLDDVAFVPDPAAALAQARARALALGLPLVVTGSLILVGAIKSVMDA